MYNYKQWRNSLPCLLLFCSSSAAANRLLKSSPRFPKTSSTPPSPSPPPPPPPPDSTSTRSRTSTTCWTISAPQNLASQRTFYEKFRDRLAALNTAKLTAEDRADLAILQDQISRSPCSISPKSTATLHNPTMYVETLGNALFSPFVLEYAPKPERIRNIIARLQKVPLYLDQAVHQPGLRPAVWTQVAIEENQGNIDLVDKDNPRGSSRRPDRRLRAGSPSRAGRDDQVRRRS